jgi:hypothetical protein
VEGKAFLRGSLYLMSSVFRVRGAAHRLVPFGSRLRSSMTAGAGLSIRKIEKGRFDTTRVRVIRTLPIIAHQACVTFT